MKKSILTAAVLSSAMALATPAFATSLIANGVTYTLNLNSVSGATADFTLYISGENTASDTEGGRTGINAIAFNNPSGGTVTSGATSGTFANWTFQTGGLNSGGCNGSGNFFCFDNPAIGPVPVGNLTGLLKFDFTATANTTGVWANYNLPDFKIDWVGTKPGGNYNLVSLGIPVNVCRDGPCAPPTQTGDGVPEPATWAMMLVGFGFIGAAMRRRKQHQAVRLSFA